MMLKYYLVGIMSFASSTIPQIAAAQELKYESDMVLAISLIEPLKKKQFVSSIGKEISLEEVRIWKYDDTEWLRGGMLSVINDDSLGSNSRVTCNLSEKNGDKFMANPKRGMYKIKGILLSYSDRGGTVIQPCELSAVTQ